MAMKASSIVHSILNDFSECIATNKLFITLFAVFLTAFILLTYIYIIKWPSCKVYLIDFACYKPPSAFMSTKEHTLEQIRLLGNVSQEMITIMRHGMHKGGIGDTTYLPEAILSVPPNPSMEAARKEAEMVMFGAIDELLGKTSVKCKDIGILIVNCSLFNIVPSLSCMIVNSYKLRANIKSYNLTGMGCSAGLVAIGLAKQLLQVHSDQYALVVSTENITLHCYTGEDRSKVATNCIFRLGGSAILISNRPSDAKSSKYKLMHCIHINNASSDISYNSIFQEEDDEGLTGITINKDLLVAAKTAITSNLATLGPLILPISEKIKFLKDYLVRKLKISDHQGPKYVPKFSKCVDHFFPHVGGKPVLDELQKILGFSDSVMEAPRMSLYRFGNTSSSSVWYEIAYGEAKGRIKKGDSLWQIAFGSGFKCSSLIWLALRTIDREEMNPWRGEIDQYPTDDLDKIGLMDPDLFFFEEPK